jgi:hypothetical protein
MYGKGLEPFTPLHKKDGNPLAGEPVSKTDRSAENMAPLFTSSRPKAVMLKINIGAS